MRLALSLLGLLTGFIAFSRFGYAETTAKTAIELVRHYRKAAPLHRLFATNNERMATRVSLGDGVVSLQSNSFIGPTITVTGFTNAAIQAAIDAAPLSGATIIIPAGRYVFTGECLIANKNNLTFSGAGSGSTEFYVPMEGQISHMINAVGPVSNIRLTGILFNNQSSASGQGMVFSHERASIDGYEIDHCSFTAPNLNCNAIKLNPQTYIYGVSVSVLVQNVYIHDNNFYSIGRMGIELQNHGWEKGELPIYQLSNIRIEDNEFTDLGRVDGNNGMAFSVTGPNQNIYVRRNKVVDAKYAAFEFVGSRDVEVSDNSARAINNFYTGISVSDNGHRYTTRLNFLRNNIFVKSNPFQIYGGDNGSVTNWVATNNIFVSTQSSSGDQGSIKLQAASGGNFNNNTVRTGGTNAVFLDNAPQNIFANNTFSNEDSPGNAELIRFYSPGTYGNQLASSNTYKKQSGFVTTNFAVEHSGAHDNLVGNPNVPPTSLRDPDNPANAVAGLDYSYYEGSWSMVPDFNTLTPVKTGTNSTPAISVSNRDNNYALRYTGYVSVPTDGQYTFYTTSDDGTKLFIGSTEVVTNDQTHGDQERSGTIGLKAGLHAFSVLYFQGGGGQSLSVSYSGPNVNKQLIPNGALYRVNNGQTTSPPTNTSLRTPENPANAVAGLDYSYYEGTWNSLPDFNALTPVKTGINSVPNLTPRNRDSFYGLRYTGYISVPTDGIYTFYTTSDDGTKLYIGNTEVVNNDGGHGDQERSGTIGLRAGVHALTVTYFQWDQGQSLSVSYSGPNISKQLIPASALYRINNGQLTPSPTKTSLRDPENPANAVAGLDYSYYEGSWSMVPDFNTLTPVKTGTNSTPAISVSNRDNNYALRYTGYVSVPTDGQYTFYTTSDDGTKLFIGSTEVVTNDQTHGDQERSGTIGLKAGLHAFSVLYFQGGGGQSLSVSYSGPNVNKQLIPNGALYRVNNGQTTSPPTNTSLRTPENPANAVAGLDYSYYEGTWNSLPDFNALTPVKTGINSVPNLTPRNRDSFYGLRYTGYISVPTDGIYTFYTTSDDGTKLYIGNTEVVNNDGGHGDQERSGTIGLRAGVHALTVTYFQWDQGQSLSVSYSGPNISKQLIPSEAYSRASSGQSPAGIIGTGTGLRAEYFNNTNLMAPVVLTRTDATIDFNWGDGSPAPGTVGVDNFSVRWIGQVEAPVTGSYVFSTTGDDGVRLWVNGNQVVDDWYAHAPTINNSAPLTLNAGQRYDIRMEYFENAGGAVAKLWWSYPGQAQQTIPKTRLYAVLGSRVGVLSEEPVRDWQVYPIPAHDQITIRYYAATASEVSLQLVNAGTQTTSSITQTVRAGENLINLSVGHLSRGIYILTLTDGSQYLTKKVLLTD